MVCRIKNLYSVAISHTSQHHKNEKKVPLQYHKKRNNGKCLENKESDFLTHGYTMLEE